MTSAANSIGGHLTSFVPALSSVFTISPTAAKAKQLRAMRKSGPRTATSTMSTAATTSPVVILFMP